jgi:hypothetical protein
MNAAKQQWLEALAKKANEAPSSESLAWYGQVDEVLNRANTVLDGHGVEPIRYKNEWQHRYYGDAIALYINMGDAYDTTLLYTVVDREFQVTSWGDWVEAHELNRHTVPA